MVDNTVSPLPGEVLGDAKHVLFVEGQSDGLDRRALDVFFNKLVRVDSLGPASTLRPVAKAMRPRHPTWYFVIDRDHHSDATVAETWKNFPEADNLLIWRRRELENYFIDPDYLTRLRPFFAAQQPAQRTFLRVSDQELRARVLRECQRRLYTETVNQVIAECRGELQVTWIEQFKAGEFIERDEALHALRTHPNFLAKRESFAARTQPDALESLFFSVLEVYTGGADRLEYGSGQWLERLHGKPVWATVANDCFRILGSSGAPLDGRKAQVEVAKDLMRAPLDMQPEDLKQLRRMLEARVRSSASSGVL